MYVKNKRRMTEQIKMMYGEWLRTEQGRKLLMKSVALKREWLETKKNNGVTVGTSGVNLELISKDYRDDVKLLEINPIGLNNMCHQNSLLIRDMNIGYGNVLGFNVTACPCGRNVCYEIHSVNMKDGEYCDFTKDFNEELTKYFIPLIEDIDLGEISLIVNNLNGGNFSVNNKCRCGIVWGKGMPNLNNTQMYQLISQLKTHRLRQPKIKVW